MKTQTPSIYEDWPTEDLDHINECPYCGSKSRTLAFDEVRDWSFNSTPGNWTYWDCSSCKSLYLDPRPSKQSIGRAYRSYYTHSEHSRSIVAQFKRRLRNEYISATIGKSIEPRFNLPPSIGCLVFLLRNKITLPFGLRELAEKSSGKYIDVGCGQGSFVEFAKQLGWNATGIEIDAEAVNIARQSNLDVRLGTYELLRDYKDQADYIYCSHVVEHVHDPQELLSLLVSALRPGGLLVISCPNAVSPVRFHFGKYWRGVEAPRHLAIPSRAGLLQLLKRQQLTIIQSSPEQRMSTEAESFRIVRRGLKISLLDKMNGQSLYRKLEHLEPDFIQLVCRRPLINL